MKLIAPIPGRIEALACAEGARIARGDVALYMESMKMKIPVYAQEDGVISYRVGESDAVLRGDVLAEICAEETDVGGKNDK
ncbi:MAG: acetyl-CoA carboxylase biotin carboxyl carrier protein subunit [Peptoniphilus sp.]|nr:acetyl-CoA carboxylase biotin carboxyl carrier protein subunit [Peptoniphilus sp.]MDD7363668.1 acetyl-CoA carboxylase biotin carboxyl carrier protein subunit [Bacillota bacterium]MDY6044053.1 acetyl-CoA carboxylase biotin carboxyl carrier protein subunit [Peptoniphilus sp.]